MNDDDLCIHELDPATCSVCLYGPTGVLPPRREPVRVITARFPGRCDRCGQPIVEGTEIGLVDDTWICCYRA